MIKTSCHAVIALVLLAASTPAPAGQCSPGGPVQIGMFSAVPQPEHNSVAFRLPTLATPAAAAEARPKSLEDFEKLYLDTERRFRLLSREGIEGVMEKAYPQLLKLAPRTELEMEYIHAIQFVSRDRGFALDWHGKLHATGDRGVTWTERRIPIPQPGDLSRQAARPTTLPAADFEALRAMQFLDERNGLVVGHRGVMQTSDGGLTWTQLGSPSRKPLATLSCQPDQTCWVAGAETGSVFRRTPGSPVWDRQATPANGPAGEIQVLDGKTGWLATRRGEVLVTVDGGEQWRIQQSDPAADYWALHFTDAEHGWVAGANAAILRTEDGGRSWSPGEVVLPGDVPAALVRLHAIRFLDPRTGFAAGLNGIILGSTDGGRCWYVKRFEGLSANSLTIYALAVSEGPVLWASGNAGNIVASLDRGQVWFPVHGQALDAMGVIRRSLDALDTPAAPARRK
jgi:photosystem II stability/assembly factor-like uncharacterized protein